MFFWLNYQKTKLIRCILMRFDKPVLPEREQTQMKIIKIYTPHELALLRDPAFRLIVIEAIGTDGFVEQYNLLNNVSLNQPKNGLEVLIDQAKGAADKHQRVYFNGLLKFIYETVYLRLEPMALG